jgi:heme/copper-type cytochrome/quinol oxidase subunit 2
MLTSPLSQKIVGILSVIVGGLIILCCGLQVWDTAAWVDADNTWYLTLKDAVLTVVVPLIVAVMLFYVGYKMIRNDIAS